MKLLIFGLVDASLSSKKQKAFVCAEADSDKDGRRFLICVLTHIDNLGSPTPLPRNQDLTVEVVPPDTSSIGLYLNIIYNNYGGQRNNSTVLRGGLMLTLLRLFRTASMIFLVKGHTTNNCYQAFNRMKQYCHKRQEWTHHQAYELINSHEEVESRTTSDFTFSD